MRAGEGVTQTRSIVWAKAWKLGREGEVGTSKPRKQVHPAEHRVMERPGRQVSMRQGEETG